MKTADITEFRSEASAWQSKVSLMMELAWLTGLVMVPLAFNGRNWFFAFTQPKQELIHVTGLILAVLWAVHIALSLARYSAPSHFVADVRAWLRGVRRSPYKLALIFLSVFVLGQLITWALSPLPAVSFLARNINDPGNNLYTILTSILVGATIAIKVRRRTQVERILWVAGGVGSVAALYGLMQYFGFDPIGYGAAGGPFVSDRVYATFGNPIFFASYLIFSLTLTMALGVMMYMRGANGRGWWLGLAVLLAALQFWAVWITDSRGPLIGAATALLVLTFMVLLSAPERSRRISVGLLLGILVVAWLTNWLGRGDYASPAFILGIIAVTGAALYLIYREWRAEERSRGWLFWALAAVALIVLEGYLLIDLIRGRTGFLMDYILVLAPALAFALFLSWGTVKVKVSAADQRRADSPVKRLMLGQQFTSPLLMRTAVTTVAASMLLAVVMLASSGFGITHRLNVELCLLNCGSAPAPAPEEAVAGASSGAADDGAALEMEQGRSQLQQELDDVSTRRTITWRGAARLLSSRESVFEENGALIAARHLFGYGQEMYVLAFPLGSESQEAFRLSANPHNLFLLVWLEHGLWGLLSFLGLLGAVIAGVWLAFWKSVRGSHGGWWAVLVSSALMGLLLGRLLEQMTGVARVSDIFMFWAVLGLMLALPLVLAGKQAEDDEGEGARLKRTPPRAKAQQRQRRRRGGAAGSIGFNNLTKYGWRSVAPAAVLVVSTVLALTMFISLDLTALFASGRAINGYRNILALQARDGLLYNEDLSLEYEKIKQAALDHPYSRNYAQDLTSPMGGESGRLLMIVEELIEPNRTEGLHGNHLSAEERLAEARAVLKDAREVLEANLEASPFSINNLISLSTVQRYMYVLEYGEAVRSARSMGFSESQAEQFGRDQTAELRNEQTAVLQDLEMVLQSYPSNLIGVAFDYLDIGDFTNAARLSQQALEAADRLGFTRHDGSYVLGFAQAQLGNLEEAVASYEHLLGLHPSVGGYSAPRPPQTSIAVTQLADIHRRLGNEERAEEWAALIGESTEAPFTRFTNPPRYYHYRGGIRLVLDDETRAINELQQGLYHRDTPDELLPVVNAFSVTVAGMLQEIHEGRGEADRAACYRELADDLRQHLDQSSGTTPASNLSCAT